MKIDNWKILNGKHRGFTLLETVIALTVILAAVVGPVALITRGIFSFSFSKNKIIAVNLAQEGLEIIRLIRENNIACDQANGPAVWAWNNDADGRAMRRMKVGVDMQSFATVQCGNASIVMPQTSISCSDPLLFEVDSFVENAGTYGYRSGTPTIFRRCVEITSPPGDPDRGDTPVIPPSDQMDVVSTVTWSDHGNDRSMVLQERLYNWR